MSNSSTLAKCDMVLSISENTVNYQFEELYNRNIIHNNWNIVMFEDDDGNINSVKTNQSQEDFKKDIEEEKFSYAFNANISAPTISIIQNESKVMSFYISFDSGNMYYWHSRGRKSELKKVDMSSWKYAFKVQIGSIQKDVKDLKWITKESEEHFKKICEEIGLPQEIFTMESLFLDFENANFSDYDEKNSKVPITITELSIFQNILSNYFKTLKDSKNPYILGYGMKLKKIEDQKKALFQPTALKYSTTYDSDANKRSFNFLMMIDKKDFSTDQNVGVLPKSLIEDTSDDGVFAIDTKLFCEKIFLQLDLSTKFSKALSKVADEKEIQMDKNKSYFFFDQRVTVDKPIISNGEVSGDGYYFSAKTKPYALTLQAGSQTGTISRNFEDNTVVVPVLKFFSNKFLINSDSFNTKVPYTIGDNKYEKDFTFTMPSFSKDTDYLLGIAIAIYIDTKQKMSVYISDSIVQNDPDYGYARTTTPSNVLYDVKADTNGKVSVTPTSGEFSMDSHKIKNDGGTGMNASFDIFHNTLKDEIGNFLDEITDIITKASSSKIILPLGKVYSFKNLKFNKNPDTTPVEQNYVSLSTTYKTQS